MLISPESPWKEVLEQDVKLGRNLTSETAFAQRGGVATFANCQSSTNVSPETLENKLPSAQPALVSWPKIQRWAHDTLLLV